MKTLKILALIVGVFCFISCSKTYHPVPKFKLGEVVKTSFEGAEGTVISYALEHNKAENIDELKYTVVFEMRCMKCAEQPDWMPSQIQDTFWDNELEHIPAMVHIQEEQPLG